MKKLYFFLYAAFSVATALLGYHIHHSKFWAFVDWVFPIIAWVKWLCYQQINCSVIRETFSFFLQ